MTPFTFYTRANAPEKWALTDVLFWRACQIIPEPAYDYSGTEYRNSSEVFSENILELGDFFGDVYFEPHETKRLDLPDDPRVENDKNHGIDGVYIDSSFSYELALRYNPHTDQAKMDAFIKEQNDKLMRAKAFEREVKEWEQIFDDFLDRYRAELLVDLKDGKLNCEAIEIAHLWSDDGDDDDLIFDAFNQLTGNQEEFEKTFIPVPSKLWISRNLDWRGGYLRAENAVYLGLRFNIADVLKQYPPELEATEELYICGNGLVKLETTHKTSTTITNRGRPAKKWGAIHMRIAEIIATEGALPQKQDALASELVEWYRNTQGESIGLTTVKARLASYYKNPNIQKS